jgi:hypothetical protein
MAVVIHRAKQRPSGEVPNSALSQPRGSRQANAFGISGTEPT